MKWNLHIQLRDGNGHALVQKWLPAHPSPQMPMPVLSVPKHYQMVKLVMGWVPDLACLSKANFALPKPARSPLGALA